MRVILKNLLCKYLLIKVNKCIFYWQIIIMKLFRKFEISLLYNNENDGENEFCICLIGVC